MSVNWGSWTKKNTGLPFVVRNHSQCVRHHQATITAASSNQNQKGFALSASAAWDGALVQLSALVSCVLTACLAVYRVCVSTWAERGGTREGGSLTN